MKVLLDLFAKLILVVVGRTFVYTMPLPILFEFAGMIARFLPTCKWSSLDTRARLGFTLMEK